MGLGPRSRPVYVALREQILVGDLPAGTRLPNHMALAAQYRVAPMTMRQILDHLETEGLISRETGRGTFVRARTMPFVLIVDDEAAMRAVLARRIHRMGHSPLEAASPAEGLTILEREPSIALVISDVRMPERGDGIEFIRTVRRRWPGLPLAALTGYPDDLAPLHGTRECPVLIVPKPFQTNQIEEVLRLVLRPPVVGAAGS